MKIKKPIQLKAALLLVVFGLNTVIGFACAIGIDMGFNTCHDHEEATEVTVHDHANGEKHEHHDEANEHHHDKNGSSKKDDCCNDKVVNLQILDKNLNHNSKTTIGVPEFVTILTHFIYINFLKAVQVVPQKYIIPNFHSPPDIRVAIQSFQI